MRVGLLTSWKTQCGIAEYSRALAKAFRGRGDIDLVVFGSRNVGDRAVREYEAYEQPVFDVQRWRPDHRFHLCVQSVLDHDLDVLHIQYSNLFYGRRDLVELMRSFPGVIALTYHDKVVSRAFPHELVDLLFAHRDDVGVGPRRLIPQGIDVRPPVVKTFGLGKSQDHVIREICDRRGWIFAKSYGSNRWLEHDELYEWLRDCDAIVLWYPEDATSGGSAAAPMAISTRRPVFVNDTEWFRDLPERTATLRKIGSVAELELELEKLFRDPYAERRSWDSVAETLVAGYHEALSEASTVRPGRERRPRTSRSTVFALLDRKPLVKATARFLPIGHLRRASHWTRQQVYSLRRQASR
jgi:hypothetical protein